jgi:folylpolyglutamate synthase/dihydropteroate synthase
MRYQDLSIYKDDHTEFISDPIQAVSTIHKKMTDQDILLITGSLHFAGYMKSIEDTIKAAIK